MENYRNKLKTLYVINVALAFVMAVIYIVFFSRHFGDFPLYSDTIEIGSREIDVIPFLDAISIVVGVQAVQRCVRINKSLKDEKLLREMFVKDNDERKEKILIMSTSIAYRLFVSIALPVSLIIGYFNMSIFVTILACLFIQGVIFRIFHAYYSKKF